MTSYLLNYLAISSIVRGMKLATLPSPSLGSRRRMTRGGEKETITDPETEKASA